MYQGIVFLPLLGFLIAAAITMAGARMRNPGADPSPDDAHYAPHQHDTSAAHASGVVHESHHEPETHAPPAWGARESEAVTTALLFVSMALSWIAFYRVGLGGHDERITLMSWVISGDLKFDWVLRIDTLLSLIHI